MTPALRQPQERCHLALALPLPLPLPTHRIMSQLTLPALFTTLSPSRASPTATALIIPGPTPTHLSYPSLARYISALAHELSAIGVRGGDVVSMSLVNSLEFVGAFFATGSLRAVSAPLNPAYKQDEVEFYLKDTGSSVLLVAADTAADAPAVKAGKSCGLMVVKVLRRGVDDDVALEVMVQSRRDVQRAGMVANANQADGKREVLEQDVALVLHTSGTTGRPKGASSCPPLLTCSIN